MFPSLQSDNHFQIALNKTSLFTRTMFHTQEGRGIKLTKPIICIKPNAWLGEAYYFWYDMNHAKDWGIFSKKKTGSYDIYKAEINCDNILDTVFNEEHYKFWLDQVEKVAKILLKKTRMKPSIKEINQYFKERSTWDEVTGIMFQELPSSPGSTLIQNFYYKKRIQLAVYKSEIITNFAHTFSGMC